MPSSMNSERISELCANAAKIVENGKGILAADESTGTIGKRFDAINLENNVENRRAYRELLFSAGKDLGKFIGGVILYEETLYQKSSNEQTFPQALKDLGILVGIKVDMVCLKFCIGHLLGFICALGACSTTFHRCRNDNQRP